MELYRKPELYDTLFSWDPRVETEYIAEVLEWLLGKHLRGLRIVDLGCGTGRVARVLSTECGCYVLCLDISPEMCRYVKKYSRHNLLLDVVRCDIAYLPLRCEYFDLGLSLLATINHLPSISTVFQHFRDIARVLKRYGLYIVDGIYQGAKTCEEWEVSNDVKTYKVRWFTEAVNGFKAIDRVVIYLNDRVILSDTIELTYLSKDVATELVRNQIFKSTMFLKPFTLKELQEPRGRVFTVFMR